MRKHGLLSLLLLFLAGCTTPPVVIVHESDMPVRYELNGKQGWWIPDATFARMMEKVIRYDEERKIVPQSNPVKPKIKQMQMVACSVYGCDWTTCPETKILVDGKWIAYKDWKP